MPTDPLRVHAEALADLDRRMEIERESPAVRAGMTWNLRGLEGRKRILQRHAPEMREGREVCGYCPGNFFPLPFPCPDWRDATGQETPE